MMPTIIVRSDSALRFDVEYMIDPKGRLSSRYIDENRTGPWVPILITEDNHLFAGKIFEVLLFLEAQN